MEYKCFYTDDGDVCVCACVCHITDNGTSNKSSHSLCKKIKKMKKKKEIWLKVFLVKDKANIKMGRPCVFMSSRCASGAKQSKDPKYVRGMCGAHNFNIVE